MVRQLSPLSLSSRGEPKAVEGVGLSRRKRQGGHYNSNRVSSVKA